MASCLVVWMSGGGSRAQPSSVIGPYEDPDLAAEDGNILLQRGAVRVEMCQLTHPAEVMSLA